MMDASMRNGILAVLFVAAACASPTGTAEDAGVEVAAETRPAENLVVLTIRNESSNLLFLSSICNALGLQRYEEEEWRSLPRPCIGPPSPPTPIEPGDLLSFERPMDGLEKGKYRFKVVLGDASHRLLPDQVRTSNTFWVE
jgi:hypothetical protein